MIKKIELLKFLSAMMVIVFTLIISCKEDDVSIVEEDDSLAVGQIYEGGIIFYLDNTGEHGLIAASYDQNDAAWGGERTDVPGTLPDIGTGQSNTNKIIDVFNANEINAIGTAAYICDKLVLNNYDDWYLPSLEELNLMYQNQNLIGGFGTAHFVYWSSTQNDPSCAWSINFLNGSMIDNYYKNGNLLHVRAIRSF